ncbi:hypothetical protein SteCoe_14851 [Stentor coeruleus]|uniref:Uncharacterized protein n=1 Tax=Stentor coeruleus TaxID=5963 RepID=A0A1R2C547_9CILI|nr:hypothetical protein SteCoe_14851 [Stentor coeruleus]
MNTKPIRMEAENHKSSTNKHQDFTTYKDFASNKSLESADFEASFGEVNGSFYSSSNSEEKNIFQNFQLNDLERSPRKSKTKEEETNYTAKPAMILERDEVKKSLWCSSCMFKASNETNCLII